METSGKVTGIDETGGVGASGTVLTSTDKGRSFAGSMREGRQNLAAVLGNADGQVVFFGQAGVMLETGGRP